MSEYDGSSANADMHGVGRTLNKVCVCYLIRSLGVGGSEQQLVQLLRSLDPDRFELHLVTLYPSVFDSGSLSDHRVTVHCIGKKGRWDLVSSMHRLRSIIRSINPQIIHSMLSVPNVLCALLTLCGVRSKVVWGLRNADMPNHLYGIVEQLVWLVERLLAAIPDVIVANSERGREWAVSKRGFPASKLRVIPNGIDARRYAFSPASRQTMRRAWGLKDSDFAIGIVGRLDVVKGHRHFLRMSAAVRSRIPGVHFIIVGEQREPLTSELKRYGGELGIEDLLCWMPHTDCLAAVYSGFDMLCLCSLSEGFPNVVAEGCAAGLRVAGFDVGDARLIAGAESAFVRVGDVEALSDAVVRLYRQYGQHRVEGGDEDIAGRFGLGRMVEAHEALYEGLANYMPVRGSINK